MGRLTPSLVAVAVALLVYAGWELSSPDEEPEPTPKTSTRETSQSRPQQPGFPPADKAQRVPSETERSRKASVDASPAPSPDTEMADRRPHEILANMRRVWDCYQAPDCTVGEATDARAEYFEAGRQIAEGMRTLIEQHQAHQITDVELGQAAHQALEYDSGRARAAAIEALGELPPTKEHLDVLTDTLDQHHDEKLFELALPQLQRYADNGHRAEVDAFLQSNLRTGAHFPARTIARNLEPFLTPGNIASYRTLVEKLPEDSPRTKSLRKALEEYQKAH